MEVNSKQKEKQLMQCPKCKEEIIKGATLCRYCGSKIGRSSKSFIIGFLILCLSCTMFYIVWSNTNSGKDLMESKKQNVSKNQSIQSDTRNVENQVAPVTIKRSVNAGSVKKQSGNLGVSIISQKSAKTIGEYAQESAQGIYYILKAEIKNNGNVTKTVDPSMFNIVDSKGRRYAYSNDGQLRLSFEKSDASFFYDQIQPSLSITRYIVFDIPKDASGLKLVTDDGSVSINLNK